MANNLPTKVGPIAEESAPVLLQDNTRAVNVLDVEDGAVTSTHLVNAPRTTGGALMVKPLESVPPPEEDLPNQDTITIVPEATLTQPSMGGVNFEAAPSAYRDEEENYRAPSTGGEETHRQPTLEVGDDVLYRGCPT